MPESPDDILRALADPERLAIAGLLARGARTADDLVTALERWLPNGFGATSGS